MKCNVSVAWLVECSWIRNLKEARWNLDWFPIKGKGYYLLCDTKKKAECRAKIARDCGQIARVVKWARVKE